MRRKELYIFFFLSIILIVFRFSTNVENIITIGPTIQTIPWSDAAGWVEGSEYIQRGEIMPEFASRRPLYPAFLSLLFTLTGGTYLAAIIGQIVAFSCSILICFYLIRNIPERYATAFFLSCIALWLSDTQSQFLTENLGAILLIISFGFLWRGLRKNSSSLYGIGLFFLSLSFFVRPWAVGCLITLPALAFAGGSQLKDKYINFLFFVVMILLGLIMNSIAVALFATTETASNYPQTLYGLVSNTLNWRAASLDPVISRYMETNIDPAFLNKIIYQRCWDIVKSNPFLFLFSLKEVYIYYSREIISVFFAVKVYLYPVFMFLFAVFLIKQPEKFKKIEYITLSLFTLLMIIHLEKFIFIFLLAGGFLISILRRNSNISIFSLLYFVGIMLSLPIVGIDGGDRVKISSDIFIFFCCATSVQQIFFPTAQHEMLGFFLNKKGAMSSLGVVAGCFIFFTLFPLLLQLQLHGNNDKENVTQMLSPSPKEIASQLKLMSNPLSELGLSEIGKQWPAPSYENVDGQMAYRLLRYSDRDSIFLKNDQGVSTRTTEFWPMSKFDPPIARTVHTRSWCIFPNTSKEYLKKFDRHQIYVLGKIIGRPRQWKYDTGYALLVEFIGMQEKDGKIKWQQIASLSH